MYLRATSDGRDTSTPSDPIPSPSAADGSPRHARTMRTIGGSVAVSAALATCAVAIPAHAATSHAPAGAIELVKGGRGGIHVNGWAVDPDTSRSATVRISLDGRTVASVAANKPNVVAAKRYPSLAGGHGFAKIQPATGGQHRVCVSALDIAPAGAKTIAATSLGCHTITVLVSPRGIVQVAPRAPRDTQIVVSGWAIDPETRIQIYVGVSVDGKAPVRTVASLDRPGLNAGFPGIGTHHGYSAALKASTLAHKVCVTGYNVLQGRNRSLGCVTTPAIPSAVPGAPSAVSATPLVNGAQVSWTAPATTGGVPVVSYVITSVPAKTSVTVSGTKRTALVAGLSAGTSYGFVVVATNALGRSLTSTASAAVTVKAPEVIVPQSGPPLISTSRYIRNLHGSDAAGNRSKTFAMGATDASYNPAGHKYLILLQFGGQWGTGNTQSATSNSFLTYAQTVAAMQGYLDGYASQQNSNAPVTIAFGTNNDIDVRATTGRLWAEQVVNPLLSYGKRYPSISVAGANDIEPGFQGTMSESQDWVQAFLAATTAKFVFNGSADGCGWTSAMARCNNGYTAAGVHLMAGGYAPTRILALPQIYNYTQPKQWMYISLTGAVSGYNKVSFAGPLTEVTACQQDGYSCSSLTNNDAWTALWNALSSDVRVKPATLPYGTDLRIN